MANPKWWILLGSILIFYYVDNCGAQKIYYLKDLEKLFLERDVSIKAARQMLNVAENQLREIRASFGPELVGTYNYLPKIEGLEKENLDIRLRQDIIQSLKIKPGRIKEFEAGVKMAEIRLEESIREALYRLRSIYLGILEWKIRADSYLMLKDIYQDLLELQKKRCLHKEVLFTEVLEVEKDLIKIETSLLYYQNMFKDKRTLLAEALGIRPDEIGLESLESLYSIPSEERLIEEAIKNRGEIRRLKEGARQEEIRALISTYDEMSISVNLGCRLSRMGKEKILTSPEIGLTFSIPFGFKGIKRSRYNQFKAKESYWRLEAERISQEIKKEIKEAYEDYLMQNSNLSSLEKEIELKKEELRITQLRLKESLKTVRVDLAIPLKIKADIIRLNLEVDILKCKMAQSAYRLLYLAGLSSFESFSHKREAVDKKDFLKALWVWNPRFIGDEQAETLFISFCQTKSIKRLFFSLDKPLLDSLLQDPNIPKFVTRLHQAGIKISALFGENSWIYPKDRKNLLRYIQLILAYNSINNNEARFDSIHLDIEPHALKEWRDEEKRKELLNMLLETFIAVKKTIMASKQKVQLEVDIPTFYDKVDPSIFKGIIQIIDVITIMVYEERDPQAVIESVKEEIEVVLGTNKGVIIGFRAKDFQREAELEDLIREVGDKLSSVVPHIGFGIHDFSDYKALAREGRK